MKKLTTLFIFTFCFSIFNFLSAQNISGVWTGILEVNIEGNSIDFPITFIFEKVKDSKCKGKSELVIIIDGKAYYNTATLEATVDGNTIKFSDGTTLDHKDPSSQDFYWCAKSGTLTLNGNTLTGPVNGYSAKGDCLAAQANLRRL